MKPILPMLWLAGLLLSIPGVGRTAEVTPAPGVPATAADHAAVAAQLEAQAVQARGSAASHRALAAEYATNEEARKTHKKAYAALAKHCSGLAASYDTVADELGQMAKIHRELAGAPGSH